MDPAIVNKHKGIVKGSSTSRLSEVFQQLEQNRTEQCVKKKTCLFQGLQFSKQEPPQRL